MTQQTPQRGKTKLVAGLLALALVVVGIDQVTKYLAEDRLTPGVIVPLVGDFLGLQLIYNPGAAFSLATGMTWIFTVVAVVVIVVVLRVARRLRSAAWAVALGLLLGGAAGNLYDRLLREPGFARGHVVDFINYNGWFVGNIADIAIVAAAIVIAVLALRGIEVDGTRIARSDEDAGPVDDDVRPVDDDSLVSEEPLAEDFSPQVPQATTDDDVDVARWVAGAPSATESHAVPAGLLAQEGTGRVEDEDAGHEDEREDVSPAASRTGRQAPPEPAASSEPPSQASSELASPAQSESEPGAQPAAPPESEAPGAPAPRRWRPLRETRVATETDRSDDA